MGDDRAPTSVESTEDMLNAYTRYFPDLLKINAENMLPQEQAKLQATQAVSPGYEKLQNELYSIYGPLYGKTSDQINANTAQSQAASDLNILKGTGRDLIQEALQTAKLADPEYYKTREQIGGRLGDLLTSIDLSGKVSGGEQEALNRGLAQENSRRGILNTPSQTEALANAVTYGNQKYERQNNAKGQLAAALGVGTQALPGMQSGVDVFKVATGKTSMPNAGDSKFIGNQQGVGNSTTQTGNNFLNNISTLKGESMNIDANRRDILDRMNEVGHALGSLT